MKKYIVTENQLKKIIDNLVVEEKQLTEIRDKRKVKRTKRS